VIGLLVDGGDLIDVRLDRLIRVAQEQLGVCLHDGDGRAELVGSVRNEPALVSGDVRMGTSTSLP
jgi:hypothetical protein